MHALPMRIGYRRTHLVPLSCPQWEAHHVDLRLRLGWTPTASDMADILCGPRFEDLPTDPEEKSNLLIEADEVFRLFYAMVESILTAKETEERLR